MGRKSPVESYPLLYLNKRSRQLVQVKRNHPGEFSIKPGRIVTRAYIQKYYEFYGVIDRHGTVIRYRKEGKYWKRSEAVAAYVEGKFKTALESEAQIIKELNIMNRKNPELAFYPLSLATDPGLIRNERETVYRIVSIEEDPLFEEV